MVSPVTVIGLDVPVAVTVVPPPVGVAVTVYDVIALPPLDEGAVKFTVACPLPAIADTLDGKPGTVMICVNVADTVQLPVIGPVVYVLLTSVPPQPVTWEML